MLTTLVLAKSYAGNLMSLLAVRHVPQPFQSLRDVLDASHVIMIWHKGSSPAQYMKASQSRNSTAHDATSGIFYEVQKTEKEGRLQFLPIIAYPSALNDVKQGRKVIVDFDLVTTSYNSKHFSAAGNSCICTFAMVLYFLRSQGSSGKKDEC
ncbi:hypothetical protein E2C01_094482 [Portunus trituberculatus]|uniref:Uncharacterized protein n=1 Tax=Portunus trituberculatus TaxID=210409 RepID=A0A5B7K0U0_PORTR|nr:hypothetical protein [Portunus trituberculatus]